MKKYFLSFIFCFFIISILSSQSLKHIFDIIEKEDSIIIKIKQKYLSIKSYHEVGIYNYMVHISEYASKDKYRDEGTYQLFLDLKDEKMVFESDDDKILVPYKKNFTNINDNAVEKKFPSSKMTAKWDKKKDILYNNHSIPSLAFSTKGTNPRGVMIGIQFRSIITPFLLPYPKARPNIFIEKLPWIIEKDSTKQEKYYKITYKRRTIDYESHKKIKFMDSLDKIDGRVSNFNSKFKDIRHTDIVETYWVRQKDYLITKAKLVYTSEDSETIWQGEFIPTIDGELPKNIFDKKDD